MTDSEQKLAPLDRRAAAEALLTAMDEGGFELDLGAIDRLNAPPSAAAASQPSATASLHDGEGAQGSHPR
jgi:hypothetical protein